MKTARLFRGLVPLLVTTLACSVLAQSQGAGPSTAAPSNQPTANVSATAALALAPSPAPELPRPLAGLEQNLALRIGAGEWTLEEGLVTSLKYMVNEATAAELNPAGREIHTYEVTGIASLAADYVKNGKEAATKAELQRLLNLMFPAAEKLKKYAVPTRAPGHLAAPARAGQRQGDVDCRLLWQRGFPEEGAVPCFQYWAIDVAGQRYELYYPLDWPADDPRLGLAEATAQAVEDAINVYRAFRPVPPAAIVFTYYQHSTHPDWDAAAYQVDDEPCRIAIFPSGGAVGETAIDNYKQIIAHELFHCLQDQNFPAKHDLDGRRWWSEATAEYFSNVVYPEVNHEYRMTGDFDANSKDHSLFEMQYENFIFFQYLGNRLGNEAIIQLMADMPTSGGSEAQQSFLAAYPGIDDLFQTFAQQYLDQNIEDSGGGMIPSTPDLSDIRLFPIGSGSFDFSVTPFAVGRAVLILPENTRHSLTETKGGELHTSARDRSGTTWAPLAGELIAGCSERQFIYVLTSTSPAAGFHFSNVSTVSDESEAYCDHCLLGSWQMDNDSQWHFLLPLLSANGRLTVNLHEFEGVSEGTFTEDGGLSVTSHAVTLRFSQDAPNMHSETTTTIDGPWLMQWYTNGADGLYTINPISAPSIAGQTTITAPGIGTQTSESNFDGSTFLPFASSGAKYQCTPDVLWIEIRDGQFVKWQKASP